MVEPKIYCKACGMVLQCIVDFQRRTKRLPTVLEVGCAEGQGVQRYAGFCDLVVAIDAMQMGRPDIDGVLSEKITVDHQKIEDFKMRNKDFNVALIIGLSQDPWTVKNVQELSPEGYDIVLLDGCHHPYEAVLADYRVYAPLVRSGGYLIFDDTYEDDISRVVDIALQEGYVTHEKWGVNIPDLILQEVISLQKT